MKVMVIVKASAASERGEMPTTELMTDMMNFNEQLVKAGVLVSGDGLKASRHGKRIRFSGADRAIIDGPFAETKDLIAGFWVWEVASMDEAVAWAKKCPNPHPGPEESELEIRPFITMEDFGAVVTPELRAQEERLRAQSAEQGERS